MRPGFTKTLKWSAVLLGGVLIGVPLLLIAINTFDQDLKPEVAAFADLSDDDVPDEQNGYFAWVGFTAPKGLSPHAYGKTIVARINERLASNTFEALKESEFHDTGIQKIQGNWVGLCGRDAKDCLGRYASKRGEIQKGLRDNRLLVERYIGLYKYPQFRETIAPRFNAPIFADPASVVNLVRAKHALVALQGNPLSAIQGLETDTAYWRQILEQSRSLLDRMIAVAAITRNAQVVSEIISTFPAVHAIHLAAIRTVAPLSKNEMDLGKVFRFEYGYSFHMYGNMSSFMDLPCPSESPWLECFLWKPGGTLFLKPNATNNLNYENYKSAAIVNRLPAPEFIQKIKARRSAGQSQFDWPWSWHFAYNPLGKIYAPITTSSIYDSYTGRIHNLDGFLRLVSLQIRARQSRIPDSGMQRFLDDAASGLRNPYTNESMQWDAASRVIYFNGYNEKADDELLSKRIEVRL